MKLFAFCYFGLLASAPAVLAQRKTGSDGKVLPRFALEDAAALTNNIRAEFDRTSTLLGAVTISNKVVTQLKKLNTYMEKTLFPAVNPQRFYPGTPGVLRARTCAERKAIFRAYENVSTAPITLYTGHFDQGRG